MEIRSSRASSRRKLSGRRKTDRTLTLYQLIFRSLVIALLALLALKGPSFEWADLFKVLLKLI